LVHTIVVALIALALPARSGAVPGAIQTRTHVLPTPTATASPAPQLPPMPTVLHRASSQSECAIHGGTTCADMTSPGYLVLVWLGEPAAYYYLVYRTDSSGKPLAGTVPTNTLTATAFGIANVATGTCFKVTEVRNETEGPAAGPWCAPPPPVAAIANQSAHPASLKPNVPTNVHKTDNLSECEQHNGNFACASLGGALTNTVLVWNGDAFADSYTIYRTGGKNSVVGTNTGKLNGVIPTAFSADNVVAGECFAVTETFFGKESPPSVAACPGAAAQSVTLKALHVASYEQAYIPSCHSGFSGTPDFPEQVPTLAVGTSAPDCNEGWISVGGAFFDLTPLLGHSILRAMLVLNPESSIPFNPAPLSCATTVNDGTSSWWTQQNGAIAPGGRFTIDATKRAGQVDVTSIVSSWLSSGEANYGFVLSGNGAVCWTVYFSPTLIVTSM
jgi:hypothetical protein